MHKDIDKVLGHITDIATKQTIKSFADSLFVVMDRESTYCTDFLSPGEINYCISLMNTYGFEDYIIYPSEKNCERNVIILHGRYNDPDPKDYVKSLSFHLEDSKINHRDVLGAILSLGVTREKLGDILFTEDKAIIFLRNTIANFVLINLNKIGNKNVELFEIQDFDFSEVKKDHIKKNMVLSSLRLDTICSGIMNVSRNKARDKILKGDVKLNHIECKKAHEIIENNSIISIKGYGRFKYIESLGRTKKDNYIVEILKYV